jgi:ADP-ribose pyrophosphatase YjhB (NUDIX family)
MILDSERRLLLIRRAREPGKGLLAMPGGFVDAGESAEQALLREVREEVGLELRDVTYFGSYPNRYPYAGVTYSTLDIFFMCGTDDPSRVRALDAVSAVEWRDPQGVREADIAFESMRAAIRAYRRRV